MTCLVISGEKLFAIHNTNHYIDGNVDRSVIP